MTYFGFAASRLLSDLAALSIAWAEEVILRVDLAMRYE
jgi:hypothetical protein